MVGLDQAYDSCERTARAHYENFPVASLLIPTSMRRHVAAVYAFARAADDFADEGDRPPGERLALLDRWHDRLRRAAGGVDADAPPNPGEPANTVEIFRALAATMRDCALPVVLFEDLLSAFRQDVTVHGYTSWDELLDYCRRSANPIGRLVLRIARQHDPARDRWSDAICTALQLANFWQDLRPDWQRGRLYVPQDVQRGEADPARGGAVAADRPPVTRRALAEVVARTRLLFAAGRPLCDSVTGRLRYELRATWLGGTRILDRIAASDYDPMGPRPSLGAADAPWLAWHLLTWRAAR
jgi:squalene synthase HpnC